MSAANVIVAIEVANSLLQLANNATSMAIKINGMIAQARAEDREISDEELAQARGLAQDARQKLVDALEQHAPKSDPAA